MASSKLYQPDAPTASARPRAGTLSRLRRRGEVRTLWKAARDARPRGLARRRRRSRRLPRNRGLRDRRRRFAGRGGRRPGARGRRRGASRLSVARSAGAASLPGGRAPAARHRRARGRLDRRPISRAATSRSTRSPSPSPTARSWIPSADSRTSPAAGSIRCAPRTFSTTRCGLFAPPGCSRRTASSPTGRPSPPRGPPLPGSPVWRPSGSAASCRESWGAPAPRAPCTGRRGPGSFRRPSESRLETAGAARLACLPAAASTTRGRSGGSEAARRRLRLAALAARRSGSMAPAPGSGFPNGGSPAARRTRRPGSSSSSGTFRKPPAGREAWRWILQAGPLVDEALHLVGPTRPATPKPGARRIRRLARPPTPGDRGVGRGRHPAGSESPPGPRVGALLSELAVAVACGEVKNRREARNWLTGQVQKRPSAL